MKHHHHREGHPWEQRHWPLSSVHTARFALSSEGGRGGEGQIVPWSVPRPRPRPRCAHCFLPLGKQETDGAEEQREAADVLLSLHIALSLAGQRKRESIA